MGQGSACFLLWFYPYRTIPILVSFLFALDKHSHDWTLQVAFQGALGEWLAGALGDLSLTAWRVIDSLQVLGRLSEGAY